MPLPPKDSRRVLPHPACLPYFLWQSSWFGTHQIGGPASQPQQSAVCPSAVCCLSLQHWVIAAVLFPAFKVGTKRRCPCLCLKPFVNRAISSALTSVVGILLSAFVSAPGKVGRAQDPEVFALVPNSFTSQGRLECSHCLRS